MGNNSAKRITQLQATLSKMEVALGAIADAVVWTGEDMIVQWCNGAFASLVQQTHRTILGSKLSEILPLARRGKQIPLESYPDVRIYQGEYETTEYHFQRRDPQSGESHRTLILRISGSCAGLPEDKSAVLVIREISECEEVAASLQESEERLRMLINATPDIICFKDNEGRWLESNQANLKFLQLTGVDYQGKTDSELAEFSDFYGDTLLNCDRTDEVAWQNQSPYRVEEVIPRPDGTTSILDMIKVPLFYLDGRRKALLVLGRDITDAYSELHLRQETQAALQAREAQYRDLVETANCIILRWDTEGNILFLNNYGQRFLGFSASEILGRNVVGTIVPETETSGRDLQGLMVDICHHPENYLLNENENIRKNGNRVWICWANKPIVDEKGNLIEILSVGTDTTDRKRAEDALKASETRLISILSSAVASITLYRVNANREWEIEYISPGSMWIWGYSAQELMADKNLLSSRIFPEDLEFIYEQSFDYILAERTFKYEYRYQHPDGKDRWIALTLTSRQAENEDYWIVTSICTDISDKKRALEDLKASEARLNMILNSTLAAIYRIRVYPNQEWEFEYCSAGSIELSGYTPEELIADKTLYLLRIVPEDCEKILTEAFAAIFTGGNYQNEYRYNHPDGIQRWISFSQSSVRDNAADSWIVTSVCTDITFRKRTEEAVRLSETKYRALYESISVAIIIGNETNIFSCNKAAEKLFGYSRYDLIGKHASELSPPCQANGEDSFTLANQHIAIAFEEGNHHFEWIHRRADGTDFPVEIWLTAVELASVKLVQSIIYDLSDVYDELRLRKQVEESLKIAKDAAESANRAKSAFLANMSHELRTPLNAIIGFAQLMERDPAIAPSQHEFIRIINRSGEHLLNLINDVLDLSKIEAGRTIINSATFDLHHLLRTLEEMFQIRTQAKHLSLEFNIAPDLPQYIVTDEGKLRQVLINLLGNAVKFTERGGIILRAKSSPIIKGGGEEDGQKANTFAPTYPSTHSPSLYPPFHSLHFEVEDTGRGIVPEEIDNLFQPFVQANSGMEAREGTGLGLTISRQFVQLMGGDINITSTLDEGSIFSFNIEVSLANPAKIVAQISTKRRIIGLAPNQPNYRILIVDDRQENRELITQLLNIVGFETRTAFNGKNAIAIWQSWQPHLIWMDMRMPVMDGYDATKYIKAKEGENLANGEILTRNKTIIIALSASAFEEEEADILAAGCDDFVRKPFQEQVIFEKMAEHLGVNYIYTTQPEPTKTGQNPQSKIPKLTSADLTVMPPPWIEELHQAATEVDADKIFQLIEQIPQTHHTLIAGVTELVRKFCFDEILELIS